MQMGCRRVVFSVIFTFAIAVAAAFALQPSSGEVDYDKRLVELGHEFAPVSKPVGIYKRVVVVDNMAYLSGHISIGVDGQIMKGKVSDDVNLQRAQQAAQRCAIAMLSSLKAELGTLNKIKRLVKTTGMVNCTDNFTDQPKVVNGCSQLFKDLFGEENGVGARAAVGMSSLPVGAIVEIEAIFELEQN